MEKLQVFTDNYPNIFFKIPMSQSYGNEIGANEKTAVPTKFDFRFPYVIGPTVSGL